MDARLRFIQGLLYIYSYIYIYILYVPFGEVWNITLNGASNDSIHLYFRDVSGWEHSSQTLLFLDLFGLGILLKPEFTRKCPWRKFEAGDRRLGHLDLLQHLHCHRCTLQCFSEVSFASLSCTVGLFGKDADAPSLASQAPFLPLGNAIMEYQDVKAPSCGWLAMQGHMSCDALDHSLFGLCGKGDAQTSLLSASGNSGLKVFVVDSKGGWL